MFSANMIFIDGNEILTYKTEVRIYKFALLNCAGVLPTSFLKVV